MNDQPLPEQPHDILTTIFETVPSPSEGAYGFTCEWEALRAALSKFGPRPARPNNTPGRQKPTKFRLTPPKEPKASPPLPLRIVVYADRVKFGAKLGTAFVESILPTIGPIEGFSTRPEPISFVFDLNVLLMVASRLPLKDAFVMSPDGSRRWFKRITFVFEPVDKDGTPVLRIGNLNFGTFPQCDLDVFAQSLGAVTSVTVFDPKVLYRGLYYARLFAKTTCEDRGLTLIEARGGRVLGADPTGVCVFEASSLANVAIRVSLKSIGVFRRILANLDPATVRLLDSDKHYIIRDRLTCIAWPKTDDAFPAAEKSILLYRFDDRVTVSRSRLRAELKAMDVLRQTSVINFSIGQDDDKDFLPAEHDGKVVQLRVFGEGPGAKLALHIRNSFGIGKGKASDVPCERVGSASDSRVSRPALDVMVDLASFLLVVEHFGSSEVCFSIGYKDAQVASCLQIEDRDEDGAWHARTFLKLVRHVGRSLPPPRAPKRARRGTGRGV